MGGGAKVQVSLTTLTSDPRGMAGSICPLIGEQVAIKELGSLVYQSLLTNGGPSFEAHVHYTVGGSHVSDRQGIMCTSTIYGLVACTSTYLLNCIRHLRGG